MQPKNGLNHSIYSRGETIFREGEASDCMYVIQAGSVEISGCKEGQEFIISIHGKGDFFGEVALLQNQVRSTTATAISDVMLIKLTKETLLDRLKRDADMAFNLLKKLIQRIHRYHGQYQMKWREDPAFRAKRMAYSSNALEFPKAAATDKCGHSLDEVRRFSKELFLACSQDNMTYYRYRFEPGATVFRKGDTGSSMFLVLSGTVGVSDQDMADGTLIDTMGPGDFFGEMALIANTPRSATVCALEAAELVAIDKPRFRISIHKNPELAIAVINTLMARLAYLDRVMADPPCA